MLLIIQSRGKHKENREFREAECISRAMTRLDVTNQVTGPGYSSFKIFDELLGMADALLIMENYRMMDLPKSIRHFSGPKVFWCIDSHIALRRHINECDLFGITHVLCSVAAHTKHFIAKGRTAHWCPNAFPSDLLEPLKAPKKHNVGFCGTWVTGRKPFYEALAKKVDVHTDIRVLGNEMVRAIRGYTIHVNRNYSVDLNYRTFETMGVGTFLLTNPTDRLTDLFTPGIHLETYRSVSECFSKIQQYLRDPVRRMLVERAGCKLVHKKHSYDARSRWMIEEGVFE